MVSTNSKEQTEGTQPEQVLLLPGHAFFVEQLALPPGLEAGEIANFAELSLESLAPFPVEQLNWGCFADTSGQNLLLYATHKERLRQLGYEHLESRLWVLPDFLGLVAAEREGPAHFRLISEQSITLASIPEHATLPDSLTSRPRDPELEAAADPGEHVTLHQLPPELSESERPVFRFEGDERTDESALLGALDRIKLSENALWAADVRAPAFKQAERNRRQMGRLVARITGYAGYAALFLIVLELGLLAGDAWMKTRLNTIAQQLPEVRRVEDKQSLMNKLDQVAQNELRPIAMLEALNRTRPGGIYFTSAEAEGLNRITIDGIANTINELNEYTESLRKSGSFELIGPPKSITRSGRTTFTVTLDYFHDDGPALEQEG